MTAPDELDRTVGASTPRRPAFFTATPAEAATMSRASTIVAFIALLAAAGFGIAGWLVAQVFGDIALGAVAVALTAEVVKFGHRVPPTSMFEDPEPPRDPDRA